MISSEPVGVYEKREKIFFGLAEIYYYIEDRRPDLPPDEYAEKYKHFIKVRILYKEYTWTLRSPYLYDYLPGKYNKITKKDF